MTEASDSKNSEWDGVYNMLECPVCNDYLSTPVRQCVTGHSLCTECVVALTECPICKKDFTATRNYVLESIIVKLLFQCGSCLEVVPKQDITHYNCCPLPVRCKMLYCRWNGPQDLLVDHINLNHKASIVENGSILKCHTDMCVLKSVDDTYFWLKKTALGQKIIWSAQHVKYVRGKEKYYFTILIRYLDGEIFEFTQTVRKFNVPDKVVEDSSLCCFKDRYKDLVLEHSTVFITDRDLLL